MSKHTPGPWTFRKHEDCEYGETDLCSFAVDCQDGPSGMEFQIATVISDHIDGHEANASLIAAAPDLLEAIIGLAKAYESLDGSVTHDGSWYSHAISAIAKATGESNE